MKRNPMSAQEKFLKAVLEDYKAGREPSFSRHIDENEPFAEARRPELTYSWFWTLFKAAIKNSFKSILGCFSDARDVITMYRDYKEFQKQEWNSKEEALKREIMKQVK